MSCGKYVDVNRNICECLCLTSYVVLETNQYGSQMWLTIIEELTQEPKMSYFEEKNNAMPLVKQL